MDLVEALEVVIDLARRSVIPQSKRLVDAINTVEDFVVNNADEIRDKWRTIELPEEFFDERGCED